MSESYILRAHIFTSENTHTHIHTRANTHTHTHTHVYCDNFLTRDSYFSETLKRIAWKISLHQELH